MGGLERRRKEGRIQKFVERSKNGTRTNEWVELVEQDTVNNKDVKTSTQLVEMSEVSATFTKSHRVRKQ